MGNYSKTDGFLMKQDSNKTSGIQNLLEKYRKIFRIPENLNHYSAEDLDAAEKKFLKFALKKGFGEQPPQI